MTMAERVEDISSAPGGHRGRRVVSARALVIGSLTAVACGVPWLCSRLGLGQMPVVSGIIAWRSLLTVGLLLGVLILVAVGWIRRRTRRFVAGLLIPLVPLAVAASSVLLPAPGHLAVNPSDEDVTTVLSWNTNGSLVDVATLAEEVARHQPDVVVLPSIDEEVLQPIARTLRERGYSLIRPSGSETAILSKRGDTAAPESEYGVRRSSEAVATAARGAFEIVAVHLRIPFLPGGNRAWADESRWLGSICDAQRPAIIVGDFNATNDNFAGTTLEHCQDAAASVGAQNAGTGRHVFLPPSGCPSIISCSAARERRFSISTFCKTKRTAAPVTARFLSR